ncbi:hypothetical protein GCM10027162_57390 [Streptomyces incanus]
MLLYRSDQWLHQKHVALAAVGRQLHLQRVVGDLPARTGLSGPPGCVRTSAAGSGWALPLNTARSRTGRLLE